MTKKTPWIPERDKERLQRSLANRRGRKNPARVPNKLTRTSAFAPKNRDLITDSNFERLYIIPGHSAIWIQGRELGTKHRDALYAVFRLTPEFIKDGISWNFETRTTWRDLLRLSEVSPHKKNVRTLLETFKDLQKVIIQEVFGDPQQILESVQKGNIGGPGYSKPIIDGISWDGDTLDSAVVISYGKSVRDAFTTRHLVSLNAEVQFRLSSDYAKSFWPFIDSQPNNNFVTEEVLAQLVDVSLWEDQPMENNKVRKASHIRADFRRFCKKAFEDMVKAGGLKTWSVDTTGTGHKKSRIYHYTHALPRQLELTLDCETTH